MFGDWPSSKCKETSRKLSLWVGKSGTRACWSCSERGQIHQFKEIGDDFFFCTDGGMSQHFEKTWKMLFFLDSLAHVPHKNEILRFAPPHLQKVQPTYFSSWEENWSFFCRGVEQTTFLSFAPWPLSRPQVNVNLQRYLTRREFLGLNPLIFRRFSAHTFHLEKKTEVFSAEGSRKQHFCRLHPHPWVHLKWMWTCKYTSEEGNS